MGNVTFLGVEGSGKTVLTMALVNLFKAHQEEGWFLRPETRNAFRFIEQIPSGLTIDSLPHQTTALRHLAWSVSKDGQVVRQMDMLDYPGEIYRLAFLDAKDDLNPEEFQERVAANKEEINGLLSHLFDSDQIFVLFNLSDAKDIAHNERNLDAVWVTNACLDYLHQLPHNPKITLLLSQVDRYVDLTKYDFDPKVYVAHHLPLIANNFPNLDVCAVAALGVADAAYGLDSILARCLVDTSFFSSIQDKIHAYRLTLENALDSSLDSTYCERIYSVLNSLSIFSAEWRNSLPWFVPIDLLIGPSGLIDTVTHQECKVFLQRIRFKLNRQEKIDWAKLLTELNQMTLISEESHYLLRKIIEKVQHRVRAVARKKNIRFFFLFILFILGWMMLAVIILAVV